MLEAATLRFLSQLKKNNNRDWFEKHRPDYEAARLDFQNFIYLLIKDLGKTDPSIAGLNAKDCLFRINRDIRFSKNKLPYKTNMGASIKRGGKKSPFCGYYFHCEPGASFIGGGLWMPEAESLKKLRQEIDYNFEEFRNIINDKKFKSAYGDLYKGEDVSLATAPKGYEKDHPAISYLKLKCFIAETKL
ncbi:MAG TPA: DUF2461 domain-containing protein, partial [Chitinophagaceae bacterium]|nr:DUF2461 domain-containing protein [Chitinophagaceae bacterium]